MANENNAPPGGDQHAAQANPVSQPAAPPPEFHQPAVPDRRQPDNPRAQGRGPAHDVREQQQDTVVESKVKFGDGTEYSESQVRDALAHQAEQQVRKQSLPKTKDDYQVKLPADFKPPEGVTFEFDKNDPGLARAREIAHARGIDQESFSDLLGVYAANKISEQQTLGVNRAAELSKLGSAANQRIDAIDTWLKSRVGDKGNLLVAQMKNYPVAAMVESFEAIIRQFSNQGGADFSQSGRQQQEQQSKVPAFTGSNFGEVRAAQDALHSARPQTPARVR
jgi:hypothetical protein